MIPPDDLSALARKPFSDAVKRFHDLIDNRDGLAFLVGAGCSKCAGLPLTREITDMILDGCDLDPRSKEIFIAVKCKFKGAGDAHIEHFISEIVDLLAITERRVELLVPEKDAAVELNGKSYRAEDLSRAVEQIKHSIAHNIEKKANVETHRAFVASIHQPIRAGRTPPSRPVDYLVLNYDTIIEDALALEQIQYADGIDGGATGWWNPETFNKEGLLARVIKLHGSIDWRQFQSESLPRRIGTSVNLEGGADLPVLIWPSSTKYREAQLDPFAQLLDRARKAIRAESEQQGLLVICGYSFGDTHVNLEIDKALRESSGNLTVAAFTDKDKPTGWLKKWHEDNAVNDQVLVFAKRGFFHKDSKEESNTELPWWKFENITRVLKGEV